MPLSITDQKRLLAAQGYLELGMCLDANEELEKIDPDVRHCPEVLVVRLSIYQEMKNWDLMQTVARNLADLAPDDAGVLINLAYATRRMESIEAARVILICALGKHPNHPTIHYNLACYDCQLGDLESSKQFLDHALKLDSGFRVMALKDKDLEPLWGSLAGE